MKHQLGSAEKENIVRMASSYFLSHCEGIIFVYFFGSFLSEGPFSDIDVGTFSAADPQQELSYELELESQLEGILKYPVDLRILNRAPLSFCYQVIRDGKVILDKDPGLRADFEGRILKEYFDFSRYRRRYLREVKSAPL